MSKKIKQAQAALETLTVYRGLLRDRVVSAYYRLLERLAAGSLSVAEFCRDYCHFTIFCWKRRRCFFSEYLAEKFFLRKMHSAEPVKGKTGVHLMQAAERDFGSLKLAALLSARELKEAAISLLSPGSKKEKLFLNFRNGRGKTRPCPKTLKSWLIFMPAAERANLRASAALSGKGQKRRRAMRHQIN